MSGGELMDKENERAVETKSSSGQNEFVKRWAIRLATLLAAFLLGFVPMWLSARNITANLEKTTRDLRRSQLQNTLSSAVINSRRAEYETARQNASSFFTEVRNEIDKADTNVFSTAEKARINGLLIPRDEIITLLSRNDPVAADRLSDLYTVYAQMNSAP